MSLTDYRRELRDRIVIDVVAVDDEMVDVAGNARPLDWARSSFKANIISAAGQVVEERYAHRYSTTYNPHRRGGNLGTILRMPRTELLPEDAQVVRVDWQTRHSWIVGTVEKVRRFQGGKVWDIQLDTPDGPCVARCEPAKHAAIGDDPKALQGTELTVYGLFDNPSDSSIIRIVAWCVVRGRMNFEDPMAALARRYIATTLPPRYSFLPRQHKDAIHEALKADPAVHWAFYHSFAYVERIPGGEEPPPTEYMRGAHDLAAELVLSLLPPDTIEALQRTMSHPKAPAWCAPWATTIRQHLEGAALPLSIPTQTVTLERML